MHTQVTVGGAQQVFEFVEGERLVHRQGTHNRQAHPFVDDPVERQRRPRSGTPGTGTSPGAAIGRGGFSRRAVARLPTVAPRDQESEADLKPAESQRHTEVSQ